MVDQEVKLQIESAFQASACITLWNSHWPTQVTGPIPEPKWDRARQGYEEAWITGANNGREHWSLPSSPQWCMSLLHSKYIQFLPRPTKYHPTSASRSGLGSSTLSYKSFSREDVVPGMSPYIQHSIVKIGKDKLNRYSLSKNGSRGRRPKGVWLLLHNNFVICWDTCYLGEQNVCCDPENWVLNPLLSCIFWSSGFLVPRSEMVFLSMNNGYASR